MRKDQENTMDIMHLRYFQAAAKTQKFTQAAELMHISQPAFSASLSKLERELGVHLFDRIGRRIQLNEYGKIYQKYVDQALEALDEGSRKLAEATTEKKRRFSLGTVSMRMIQEMLSDFQMAFPDIIVRRYEIMPKDVNSELHDSRGGSDIIVTASPGELDDTPGCRVIKREPLFVAVSKRHPLAGRGEVFLSELKGESFVSLPEGYSFRNITEDLCHAASFDVDILHECFHCQLLNCVSDEIGISLVTESTMKQERSRGANSNIAFLRLKDDNAFRSVVIRWDPNRELPEAAKLFLDFATSYFSWGGDSQEEDGGKKDRSNGQ